MAKAKLTIRERIEQMENHLTTLKAREREQERKNRTRYLIKLGGIVLKNIGDGRSFLDGDDDRLDEFLKKQNERGQYFTKAMNPKEEETPPISSI